MPRLVRSLLVCLLAVLAGASALAGDFPIKFSPPPNPMLNMTATEITTITGIDYMGITMDTPSGPFTLNAFTIGTGRIEKAWANGGWAWGVSVPIIIGKMPMGGGDDLSVFGFGENFPINFFIDPLSKDVDDNSMPIYFGGHFNLVDMIASGSYSYRDYYGFKRTYTIMVTSMALMYGVQAGVQLGLNLGSALKFIPYVDLSKDIGGVIATSMSAGSMYSSDSMSLPAQPLVATPGFDLLFRPLNLSLGGAYQTVTQESGSKQKTLMLHLRFVKRFRSICGE